jgi:hypothetical protein
MATTLDSKQGAVADIHRRPARGRFGWAEGNPCRYCGSKFSDALGRRRHERRSHERSVPSGTDLDGAGLAGDVGEIQDLLDDPRLTGDALRTAANRRLRYLAAPSEET